MTPARDARLPELRDLIERYWDLAYAEGKEGRDHDTENGDAQECLYQIEKRLHAFAAARRLGQGGGEVRIPSAAEWCDENAAEATMEWRAGWDACRVEYPRTAPPSAPVVVEGLADRIADKVGGSGAFPGEDGDGITLWDLIANALGDDDIGGAREWLADEIGTALEELTQQPAAASSAKAGG